MLPALGGCYTVNQEHFTKLMEEQVKVGMLTSDAIRNLTSGGFDCDAKVAAPAISCTRTRQSFIPYTCIERINIYRTGDVVSSVKIPQIMCAGL